MGILKVENNNLQLTSDPDRHILPCISDKGNKTKTKWSFLIEIYLKPHYKQVSEKFKNLKRQLEDMETKPSREKRSLFSSIFGLAGASETRELRKALKTELSNQEEMASNMAGMLRSQIQVAEIGRAARRERV